MPITLRPAASANRLAGRSSMTIALAASSTARAMASHSPSPSRPRDVSPDGDLVGARTSNQRGRTGIEGAISRATAGRNKCGLENGRNEIEALDSSESDERAGV